MSNNNEEELQQVKPIVRPYVDVPAVGQYFKKNGQYDGRLFHSMDKITYTFVSPKKEVISLHFDRLRKAIFYKGHNITNLPLSDEQFEHLTRFQQAIEENSETKKFITAYTETLKTVIREHPA